MYVWHSSLPPDSTAHPEVLLYIKQWCPRVRCWVQWGDKTMAQKAAALTQRVLRTRKHDLQSRHTFPVINVPKCLSRWLLTALHFPEQRVSCPGSQRPESQLREEKWWKYHWLDEIEISCLILGGNKMHPILHDIILNLEFSKFFDHGLCVN